MSAIDQQVLRAELGEAGFELRSGEENVNGPWSVMTDVGELRVSLPRDFPQRLPTIYLDPPPSIASVPHVSTDGWVCYARQEQLSVSLRDPVGVIVHAVTRARDVVARGFAGESRADLAAEAEWYWSIQSNHPGTVLSSFWPGSELDIVPYWVGIANLVGALSGSDLALKQFWPKWLQRDPDSYGVYLPLIPGCFDATFIDTLCRDSDGFERAVLQNIEPSLRAQLPDFVARGMKGQVILVGVPRPSGGYALLGLDLRAASSDSPLRPDVRLDVKKIQRFTVHRLERETLVPRSGAEVDLADKHVVVIGCGAVGGYLAAALARTGVGQLTLVDHDRMSAANTYRHLLGLAGVYKAEGLTAELRAKLPYLKVDARVEPVQETMKSGFLSSASIDLVVACTASPTLDRQLSREIHGTGPRLLTTWLEPLGLGGHALLNARRGQPGCVECLYVGRDGQEQLHARSDFAAPGQDFTRVQAGCLDVFTPYADLDAQETANLAARLAVEALRGDAEMAVLRSWRGSADRAYAQGFATTPRFALTHEALVCRAEELAHPRCPVCA